MLKKINKLALASVAAFILVLSIGWFPGKVLAVYNQYQATKYNDVTVANLLVRDSGVYDSGGTLRLVLGSLIQLTNGQLSMGTSGVALSTATTTGFSSGSIYYAYLNGSTAAIEGSVLIATATINGQGIAVAVAPTTGNSANVVGVAASAVSTGSIVGVYSGGSFAMALSTGIVIPGDQLATSTIAAGYLYAPTSGTSTLLASSSTCAISLGTGTVNGGRLRVRIR